MARFRLVMLSLLIAIAGSSIATSSSSAASCSGGTIWLYCNDAEVALTSGSAEGLGGLALLASKVGATEVKIEWPKVDVEAHFFPLPPYVIITIKLLFGKVTKPANCSLSAAGEKEIAATGEETLETGTAALWTGLHAGQELASITIEGASCPIAGTYTLSGKQHIELPEGSTSLVEHELVAKKIGSVLKFGAETASFSSTSKAKLSSGLAWLTMLGS